MKIIQGLQQGSESWLAHRRTTRNASDAPAMMGASPYVTRAELIRRVATGIEREVDAATQARFDRGHAVEPALRALAEARIGDELYPVTGVSDDGYLGASFDGVTLAEDTILEAKQPNAEKMACIRRGEIPAADRWQIVQQFAVCESAQRCLYLVGDGTEEGTAALEITREQVAGDISALLAGWAQFDADVAAYVPEETKPAPAAAVVEGFGALSLQVEGRIIASNLDAFKAGAEAFIARLPKPADLQTDQDFADAKAAVKACEEAESRIDAAKDAAQAQMADVDSAFRLADTVRQTIRTARLALDKVVKVEEQARKESIVSAATESVRKHYACINATMGEHALQVPSTLQAVIGAAIKGKRTLATIKDAADGAAAQAKIDASQVAERTRACMAVLDEFKDHASLFADRVQLCATKAPDDLRNLARARVAEHEQREAAKLEAERERIRQEEADKLAREAADKAAAEVAEQKKAAAAAQQDTPKGFDGSAAPEPSTKPQVAPAQLQAGAARTPAGATVKLGDVNAWIAPLSISADGLAQLGFRPVASRGAAKLYAASDFPHICGALARLVAEAPARVNQAEAA